MIHDSPKSRWTRQHGAGEQHGAGRRGRGGKVVYRTFWAAAQEAAAINYNHRNNVPPDFIEPYPCRWGNHWAHGETAALHWHLGHPPETDRLL